MILQFLWTPYFVVLVLVLLAAFLKPRVWDHLDIYKDWTNTGFEYLSDEARKRKKPISSLAKEIMKKRNPGDLPPVFPNGWIPILQSRDLAVKQVKSAFALGREFVVFRGENKKAYVLDPFCPHLGANLAVGGRVDGNCIKCPFHAWKFRGEDGTCVSIPLTDKVPNVARAKPFQSWEVNGFIYVWYHAEGEEPSWNFPEIPAITNGELIYRGRSEHVVRCHVQEFFENSADIIHFGVVHKPSVFSGKKFSFLFGLLQKILKHEWEMSWTAGTPPNKHVAHISISHKIECFGYKVPFTDFKSNLKQIGPLTMHVEVHGVFGKTILVQNIIPENHLNAHFVQHIYMQPTLQQWYTNLLFLFEITMLERDIKLWNNKKFLKNPVLVKADLFINPYRRFYSQFYSENSPKLSDLAQNYFDW